MGRFLALTLFLVIAAGLVLRGEVEIPPFMSWVGGLPGDLIIKKGAITIFLPFTSAFLASSALSLFLSLFKQKSN